MTNYELFKRWSHVCYVAELLSRTEKMNVCGKYRLITNLSRLAFGMYRVAYERMINEPDDTLEF